MSASNWTTCPKCGGEFREDFEFFGASEGVVQYYYEGSCRKCRAHTKFQGEHKVE